MMEKNDQILFFNSQDGKPSIEVRVEEDTVWLNQAQMIELFGQSKQHISLHIRNIFREEELMQDSVVKNSLTTATDGKTARELGNQLFINIFPAETGINAADKFRH